MQFLYIACGWPHARNSTLHSGLDGIYIEPMSLQARRFIIVLVVILIEWPKIKILSGLIHYPGISNWKIADYNNRNEVSGNHGVDELRLGFLLSPC